MLPRRNRGGAREARDTADELGPELSQLTQNSLPSGSCMTTAK